MAASRRNRKNPAHLPEATHPVSLPNGEATISQPVGSRFRCFTLPLSKPALFSLACLTFLLMAATAFFWPPVVPFLLSVCLTIGLVGPYALGPARLLPKVFVVGTSLILFCALAMGATFLWGLGLTLATLGLLADRLLGGATTAN